MHPKKVAVTGLIIVKNEADSIYRCVQAASQVCDQVIVVDSGSTDETRGIASRAGADVVEFVWDRKYPKKKQWSMNLDQIDNAWVLLLDADEIVTPPLAREVRSNIAQTRYVAFDIPLEYYFLGSRLRFGHRVYKRSLFLHEKARFPEIADLDAPGANEVEGHYQPTIDGAIGKFSSTLTHDDPGDLAEWLDRHNRYSSWEAYLRINGDLAQDVRASRSRQGQLFDRTPGKPVAFFLYCFIIRLGFLDGRAGFAYAYALSFYYWSIGVKARSAATKRIPTK